MDFQIEKGVGRGPSGRTKLGEEAGGDVIEGQGHSGKPWFSYYSTPYE